MNSIAWLSPYGGLDTFNGLDPSYLDIGPREWIKRKAAPALELGFRAVGLHQLCGTPQTAASRDEYAGDMADQLDDLFPSALDGIRWLVQHRVEVTTYAGARLGDEHDRYLPNLSERHDAEEFNRNLYPLFEAGATTHVGDRLFEWPQPGRYRNQLWAMGVTLGGEAWKLRPSPNLPGAYEPDPEAAKLYPQWTWTVTFSNDATSPWRTRGLWRQPAGGQLRVVLDPRTKPTVLTVQGWRKRGFVVDSALDFADPVNKGIHAACLE